VLGFPDADQTGGGLFRLSRQECIAIDLEQTRLALPASAAEGINGRADVDLDEPAFFQHIPPACARQATSNSISPKVDVADRRFRHGLSGCDVGELQASARLQHPDDLVEDAAFVGAQVDDAVADDDIRPAGLDGQILDDALAKLDIAEAHRRCRRAGALEHFVGHIHADHVTLGPDLFGGDEAVKAATSPEIDDAFSRPQRTVRKRIPYPGKCLDCTVWHSGDHGIVIAQATRQRASGMEVVAAVRIDSDCTVFCFDFLTQCNSIYW